MFVPYAPIGFGSPSCADVPIGLGVNAAGKIGEAGNRLDPNWLMGELSGAIVGICI